MNYWYTYVDTDDDGHDVDDCVLVDPVTELLSHDTVHYNVTDQSQSSVDTDQLQESIEELQASTEEVQSPTTSTRDTTLSNTSLVSIPFTCGCSRLLNGKPCSSLFTQEYYESMRDCCAEMTKAELDNLLLGQIMAFTSTDEKTKCVSYHTTKQREKVKSQYYHAGHKVCWKTFAYLHGIGKQYTML